MSFKIFLYKIKFRKCVCKRKWQRRATEGTREGEECAKAQETGFRASVSIGWNYKRKRLAAGKNPA